MSFKQGINDVKRMFNPTRPGLPEADAAMVADAERLYAEGKISIFPARPISRERVPSSRCHVPRPPSDVPRPNHPQTQRLRARRTRARRPSARTTRHDSALLGHSPIPKSQGTRPGPWSYSSRARISGARACSRATDDTSRRSRTSTTATTSPRVTPARSPSRTTPSADRRDLFSHPSKIASPRTA